MLQQFIDYTKAWVNEDFGVISNLCIDDIVFTEEDGKTHLGLNRLKEYFKNTLSNKKIEDWILLNYRIDAKETMLFAWKKYIFDNDLRTVVFGTSVVRYDKNKIASIKSFTT